FVVANERIGLIGSYGCEDLYRPGQRVRSNCSQMDTSRALRGEVPDGATDLVTSCNASRWKRREARRTGHLQSHDDSGRVRECQVVDGEADRERLAGIDRSGATPV